MSSPSLLRSLTRLTLGSIALIYDGLQNRLKVWENRSISKSPLEDQQLGQENNQAASRRVIAGSVSPKSKSAETDRDLLRYAIVGVVFLAEEEISRGISTAGRASNLLVDMLDLWSRPVTSLITSSRPVSPVRRAIDHYSEIGRKKVEEWIDVGRQEEIASRELAREAINERIDHAIEYLTANEEVKELVQSQSAGLVDNVIEEARERTVSADNFLEALARSLLRRPQRWELPEPPTAIRSQALPARLVHGRPIKHESKPESS